MCAHVFKGNVLHAEGNHLGPSVEIVSGDGVELGLEVVAHISKKKLVLFLLIPFLPPK